MKRLYSFLTVLVAFSFIFAKVQAQCSGTPVSGTIVASSTTICAGNSTVLMIGGGTTGTDITFQWEESTDGGITFNTVSGAVLDTFSFSPSVSTAYRCLVTCTASSLFDYTDTAFVNVNALPTASVSGGGTYCAGSPIPDISIEFTGAGPWSFIYTDGISNDTVLNISTSPFIASNQPDGNYSIVAVSDANSCGSSGIGSVTLTTAPIPTATVSGGGSYCAGSSIPDITVALTGSAPWTFIYTDGSTNDTIFGITSSPFIASNQADGNYSLISVTDGNGCFSSASGSVTISTIPGPAITDSITNPSSCNNFDGSIDITLNGAVSPTYIWTPGGATTEDLTGLTIGTYGVQISDQGCNFTRVYTLSNANATVTTPTVTNATCGLSDGDISLAVSGNTAPYTFSWSTGDTTSTLDSLPAGTYSCVVTDSSGCTEIVNAVVSNTNIPTTVTGTVSYLGAPFSQGFAILFGVTDTTAFKLSQVSALDSNGNYTFSNVPSGANYIVGIKPGILADPSIVFTFSGNRHRWDMADTLTASCSGVDTINIDMQFVNTPSGGTATVSGSIIDVTDSTDQRRPGEPVIGVDVSVEQIPGGSQVMRTSTDASGNYSFANVPVGDYKLFVNVPGCSMINTYSISITASEQVVNKVFYVDSLDGYIDTATIVPFSSCSYVASYFANDVCLGDTTFFLDLSTGVDTSAMGYRWDFDGDGVADDTTKAGVGFIYSTAGTFNTSLIIFSYDSTCAADTARLTINVNQLPRVIALPDTSVCTGNNLTLNASGANTYLWNSNSLLSDTTIANPVVNTLMAGVNNFIVTGIDTNGCVASDTASITILLGPIADFYVAASVCSGTLVDFYDSTLNADSQTQYFWDFDNDGVTDDTTQGATSNTYPAIGVKTPELLVVGSNGCRDSVTLNVTVNANPLSVSAGFDKTIVCGASTQIVANSNQTGVTYSWTPHSFVSNPFISNPNAVPDTTIQYIVTAIKNGCAAYDTVIVNVTPLSVTAGPDLTITCGNLVQLQGNSNGVTGTLYQWTPGTSLTSQTVLNPKASPDTTTMYIVTAAKNTCYATDTMVVTVNPYSISAGSDQTITCGKTAVLTSSVTGITGVTYSWWPSQGLNSVSISGPVASPTQTTTYHVAAKKGTCMAADSVVITVVPFNVSAGSDISVNCGETSQLVATSYYTSGAVYQWTPNTGLSSANVLSPAISTTATAVYTLTVTKGACSSSDDVTVTVDQTIPMSFSANKTVFSNIYPPYSVKFSNTTPNSSNLNFTWDFGDGTGLLAGTSSAYTHSYSAGGTFSVTLYASTLNGACKDTLKYTDYIIAWSPNALPSMLATDNGVSLYPSPGNGEFVIDLKELDVNKCTFEITDLTGRKASISNYKVNAASNTISVDMKELPGGVYLIKLENESGQIIKRYVKQ